MFYKKELSENMSQGARLKFIRENKGIKLNDIAEYLGYSSNSQFVNGKIIQTVQILKIYIG